MKKSSIYLILLFTTLAVSTAKAQGLEVGYALGIDFSIKMNDRIWIGLDSHCHNYNYFGEYLGVGLGATLKL